MSKLTEQQKIAKLNLKRIFAKKLKFHLSNKGYRQIDLANALGITEGTVSNWCNPKSTKIPKIDTVEKICEFLKINKSDLLEDDEKPITELQQALIDRAKALSDSQIQKALLIFDFLEADDKK